jgi:molecular chaperone DnaK
MAERAIGIDLGTSNSCVATMRGNELVVIPNVYGENTSASVVFFAEDGSITVGNAARANIIHDPEHTVSSAKRLIGRYFFSEEVKKAQAICSYEIIEGPNHGVRIQIRDEAFSLPEISAMVLREMKQQAETYFGDEVRKAVITVPAYFNDNQRQATKDAGKIAGLEVLRILNEPTAAALAYGFGKGLDQRVAVYDLGGGTFDVSILEIGKDIFEVLSTCGDTFLGGDDFDDRIIDLVADEFVQREGINIRNDRYAFEKLKMAAEAAKRGLSVEDEVEIRIPDIVMGADGQPRSILRMLTTTEFNNLVADLIQRTFKVCDEAMQQADLTVKDLDGVILVGGPTRLPVIREAVRAYFQTEPRSDVDPDEVVALGAAIHANSLVNESAESFLLDVTPLDLRIGVAGGLAEPVIERNTPVPIEQSRLFTTFSDYQETVDIRVYQGDSREAARNELLGQFEFSGFKKARRGEVTIEVTFEINADGIVSVKACDPETGAQTQTTITLSSGLSEDELESILEEDPAARVQRSAPVAARPRPAAKPKAAPTPKPKPHADLAALPDPEPEPIDDADDDLDVLAGSDDSEAFLEDDSEIGADLDDDALSAALSGNAIDPSALEVEAIPGGADPDAVASGDALMDLDGRAFAAPEAGDELDLLADGARTEALLPDRDEPMPPAGEAVVALAADEVDALFETEEAAVVELEPADLEAEVVLETEAAPTRLADTEPDLADAAESNPDELFDRNTRNLSAGLDEDS